MVMVFVTGGADLELRIPSHLVTLDVIVEVCGALLCIVNFMNLLLWCFRRSDSLGWHGLVSVTATPHRRDTKRKLCSG